MIIDYNLIELSVRARLRVSHCLPGMLTRPDITSPRPRPNHRGRGRGRKVYRYGRVNESCNYVTYFGYVIKKMPTEQSNI